VPAPPVHGLTIISGLDVLGTGAAPNPLRRVPLHVFSDADTDYTRSGTVTVRNFEPSELFDTVGSVLCVVSQFRADVQVNQGPYVVLYDQARCKAAANSRSGQAPGLTAIEGGGQYALAYVNATRADDSSPQMVQAWIPFGDGGLNFGAPLDSDPANDPTVSYKQVDVRIDASPSTDLPYGKFALTWSNLGNTRGGSFVTLDDASFPGYFGFQYFEATPVGQNYPRPGDFLSDVRRGTVYLDAAGQTGFALSEARFFNGQGTIGDPFDWTQLPPDQQSYFSQVANVSQITVGDGHVRARLGQVVDNLASAGDHCLDVTSEQPFVDNYRTFDADTGAAVFLLVQVPFLVDGCNGNGDLHYDGRVDQVPGCATTVGVGSVVQARPAPANVVEMQADWMIITLDTTSQVVQLQNVATGEIRTLDHPLSFDYTHVAENDRFQTGGYVGQQFTLTIDDTPAINGLPYTIPAYAFTAAGSLPYYDLSLVDGLLFTDTAGTGRQFTTKARRVTTWFPTEADVTDCQTLDLQDLTINPATTYPIDQMPMAPDPSLRGQAPLYIGGSPAS
jgi:hypothetical protein